MSFSFEDLLTYISSMLTVPFHESLKLTRINLGSIADQSRITQIDPRLMRVIRVFRRNCDQFELKKLKLSQFRTILFGFVLSLSRLFIATTNVFFHRVFICVCVGGILMIVLD